MMAPRGGRSPTLDGGPRARSRYGEHVRSHSDEISFGATRNGSVRGLCVERDFAQ